MHFLLNFARDFSAKRWPRSLFALQSRAMFGSIMSVLLMGMMPVWGAQDGRAALISSVQVAPPAVALPAMPALSASGAMVVDLDSGQTLFGLEADTQRPMASLTKLMTALIIVEQHQLDEIVTVPSSIGDVEGTVAHLPAGEQFTVGDLLSALLIESANDAAVTLARFHSGSVDAFVDAMNERAQELGLVETSYQNPVGLDAPQQRSTPRELAWLASFVLRQPAIAERMSTPSAVIHTLSGRSLTLVHTHRLLLPADAATHVDGLPVVLAGKTGTTYAAKQCLLSIIEQHGRRYVVVLLHSADRYADMQRVLTAFAS